MMNISSLMGVLCCSNTMQKIRTVVRELEQSARGIYTAMQGIHHTKANDGELCVWYETFRSKVYP